jgi:hypothetical protein
MKSKTDCDPKPAPLVPGTGALCAEAQADGVPCYELGRDCQVCGKARPATQREWPDRPIATS